MLDLQPGICDQKFFGFADPVEGQIFIGGAVQEPPEQP